MQAAAKILDETARFSPAELVCNSEFLSTPLAKEIEERFRLYLNDIDSRMYEYNTAKDTLLAHFKVKTLESFGLQKKLLAVSASGAHCCRSSFLISERNPEDSLVPYDNDPSLCSREIYAYRQFQPQKSGADGNHAREEQKRLASERSG